MAALTGIGVLVTRPQHQASPLCSLLEARGAATFRLPAIDIEPITGALERAARLIEAEAFDFAVFVSANAVRFGAAILRQRQKLVLAAVGPATARALGEAGHQVAVVPSSGFDSESLLAHFEPGELDGRRVLLVKGSGGRDLLEREFARRGAVVRIAEVYRRERAQPAPAQLAELERHFAAGAIDIVTATSLEIGENLLAIATPALRAAWERTHWLVPGGRVADGMRRAGLTAPLLKSDSAEDQDLVDSILRWRSRESGA